MKKKIIRSKELAQFQLGETQTQYAQTYSPKVLEFFQNKNPKAKAWTSLICTEFTSLCPKTGQPDFAKIFINYIGGDLMVESKSLKLYLFSFRNHGDFHEDCIQTICDDLYHGMKPHFIEVCGEFTPRGGIAIYPYSSLSDSSQEFKTLRQIRQANYRPGLYSLPMSRIYA